MSLRVGVDLDGVLADFAAAYREHERRLFGRVEVRLEPDTTADIALFGPGDAEAADRPPDPEAPFA